MVYYYVCVGGGRSGGGGGALAKGLVSLSSHSRPGRDLPAPASPVYRWGHGRDPVCLCHNVGSHPAFSDSLLLMGSLRKPPTD